ANSGPKNQGRSDYLRSNPAQTSVWKNADNKTLKKDFSPLRIREELDKRDGYTQQDRKKFYDLVSQHASHATYKGFQLTTQGGLGRIGPFVDEAKLQGLARRDGEAVRSCRNTLARRLRGNGPQGGADAEALPRHDEP